jgi:hypothetical protein
LSLKIIIFAFLLNQSAEDNEINIKLLTVVCLLH